MALHNILVKVKWVNDSPLFPRPVGLAEEEPWAPDYWAVGDVAYHNSVQHEGRAKGFAIYRMNGLTDAAYNALKADTANYRWKSDVVEGEE